MVSMNSYAECGSSVINDMKWLCENVLTDDCQAKAGAEAVTQPE